MTESASVKHWINGPLMVGVALGLLVCLPALHERERSRIAAEVGRERVARLVNGGFESLEGWTLLGPASPSEGRDGSRGLRMEPGAAAVQGVTFPRGASATVLRIRGWSRAEGVDGAPDAGYSLYADVEYRDGRRLYGQVVPFSTGSHGWERRELLLPVDGPVRTVTLNALFRGHAGRAWFDDLEVEERAGAPGSPVLHGVPVKPRPARIPPTAPRRAYESTDGLRLVLADDRIASVGIGGTDLTSDAPSGFLVRDVGADSDFHHFREGRCGDLGLRLEARIEPAADHLVLSGRLHSTEPRDRALALVVALPIDAEGWTWGEDILCSATIRAPADYAHVTPLQAGSTATLSRYPLAAVSSGDRGIAVGIDPELGAQVRLGYQAGMRQLYAAFDFGLTAGSPGAPFRLVFYRFEGHWGFRAAVEKYYRIFPEAFATRARVHGTWLPFSDPTKIRGVEDFGFAFHEGPADPEGSGVPGLLKFRYTEPLAAWIPMAADRPRTPGEALRALEARAGSAAARSIRAFGMRGPEGELLYQFRREPWCDGAVFSMNPSGAGEPLPGPFDGEFLDSMEGYATAELDLSPDHVVRAGAPPTFSVGEGRPAVFKGQAMLDHARERRRALQDSGKLLFGNGVPDRFGFLCALLDVAGTERDWLHPPDDRELALWRTMSFQKPYAVLVNSDFSRFGPEELERCFHQCLMYGLFPGPFSANASDRPGWENEEWVEAARPVFRKYVPLLRRLAAAGWQPVTRARPDAGEKIRVERFGPDAWGTFYLAVSSEESTGGILSIESGLLEGAGDAVSPRASWARELVSGRRIPVREGRIEVSLEGGRTWLLEFPPREP